MASGSVDSGEDIAGVWVRISDAWSGYMPSSAMAGSVFVDPRTVSCHASVALALGQTYKHIVLRCCIVYEKGWKRS